jgi:hypothetical protein
MSDDQPTRDEPIRLCPHCGAPLAPDQDWCLECGTAATTRVMAPPSWRVPAAVIAAVVIAFGIAVAIAVSVLSHDADRSVAPVDGTASAAAAPAAATAAVSAPAKPAAAKAPAKKKAATAATGATGDTGATGATGGSGKVVLWDEAKTAYTVVLVTSDRAGAEKVAKSSAADAGTGTGILETAKYQFFSPGLWVAWAGVFDSKPAAQKLAEKLGKGYVTQVKKK